MGKRILINDADADVTARLRATLEGQGRDFDILVTHDGAAALEIVRRTPVDLVITGLHTPGVDGLKLLTEVNLHHPEVRVIVMVDPATQLPRAAMHLIDANRTQQHPPDLRELTSAVFAELQMRVSGEVWGIQLTSFLQMLNADLKSCTVTVTAGDNAGTIHLVEGELVAALAGAQAGDDALYTILSWNRPTIQVDYLPFTGDRNISAGLMGLLLEAQRRRDTELSDIEQKRRHPRFNCLVAVDFDLGRGSYRHLIRNLSQSGAFIETDADMALGSEIDLMLFSMKRRQHCNVRGRIMRRDEGGFGVQFVSPSDEQTAFLRAETSP